MYMSVLKYINSFINIVFRYKNKNSINIFVSNHYLSLYFSQLVARTRTLNVHAQLFTV